MVDSCIFKNLELVFDCVDNCLFVADSGICSTTLGTTSTGVQSLTSLVRAARLMSRCAGVHQAELCIELGDVVLAQEPVGSVQQPERQINLRLREFLQRLKSKTGRRIISGPLDLETVIS